MKLKVSELNAKVVQLTAENAKLLESLKEKEAAIAVAAASGPPPPPPPALGIFSSVLFFFYWFAFICTISSCPSSTCDDCGDTTSGRRFDAV